MGLGAPRRHGSPTTRWACSATATPRRQPGPPGRVGWWLQKIQLVQTVGKARQTLSGFYSQGRGTRSASDDVLPSQEPCAPLGANRVKVRVPPAARARHHDRRALGVPVNRRANARADAGRCMLIASRTGTSPRESQSFAASVTAGGSADRHEDAAAARVGEAGASACPQADPGVREKPPFMPASALQSGNRNCSPTPNLVL